MWAGLSSDGKAVSRARPEMLSFAAKACVVNQD
jgi:hypothetical protein